MAAGFAVTISATDHASATLARVNQHLQASRDRVSQITAPFAKFGQELKQFSDVSGVNKFGAGLHAVTERAERFGAGLARLVPALGALSGAASVAGIVAMTVKFGNAEAALGQLSHRLGTSAENLSELQIAMKLANGSAEDLTAGAQALKGSIQDAIGGRSPEALEAFNRLGISFKDAAGKARPLQDVIKDTVAALSRIKDPQLQATIGAKLYGGSIEGMIPLIGKSAEAQRALYAEAHRLNGVTDEGVRQAGLFATAQARVGISVEQMGNKISEKVLPFLTPLLERLATFMTAHSDQVAAFFERVAVSISAWVDGDGIGRTVTALTHFAEKVDTIAQSFGGWEVVAKGLLVYMAGAWTLGMIASITSVMGSVTALGSGLKGLSGVGVLSRAAPAVAAAYGTHLAYGSLPQSDRISNWFDNHVPGLNALDNLLSHIGMGTSYEDQATRATRIAGAPAQRAYDIATPSERHSAARFPAPPAPSSDEQKKRAGEARDLFMQAGYTKEQSAGLIANIQKESQFNPGAIGDGGQGRGLAQWHPDRQKAILDGSGIDVRSASYTDQVKAMIWEMAHTEKPAGDAIRRTRTADEAGSTTSQMFERPKDTFGEMANRGASATDWLRQWNAAPSTPRTAMPMPSGAPLSMGNAANSNGGNGGAGAGGRAIVDVTFTNPPAGANVSMRTQGDLEQGNVRIARPNLLTGTP